MPRDVETGFYALTRVLVIDDDLSDFEILRAELRKSVAGDSYRLDWRPTPEEGLKGLKEGAYDL
ncbi:MAG: hypothetical protein AAFZ18_19375, partial [Myxococcota bacterium]